jgi:hypothetical protein
LQRERRDNSLSLPASWLRTNRPRRRTMPAYRNMRPAARHASRRRSRSRADITNRTILVRS